MTRQATTMTTEEAFDLAAKLCNEFAETTRYRGELMMDKKPTLQQLIWVFKIMLINPTLDPWTVGQAAELICKHHDMGTFRDFFDAKDLERIKHDNSTAPKG